MMIKLITNVFTEGFGEHKDIKQLLDMKSEIIYFDNNRRLNTISVVRNLTTKMHKLIPNITS